MPDGRLHTVAIVPATSANAITGTVALSRGENVMARRNRRRRCFIAKEFGLSCEGEPGEGQLGEGGCQAAISGRSRGTRKRCSRAPPVPSERHCPGNANSASAA